MSKPKRLNAEQQLAVRMKRRAEIIKLAKVYEGDGDNGSIDMDDDELIKISEGGDNGAYVSAWVWVSFADTPLDKEPKR